MLHQIFKKLTFFVLFITLLTSFDGIAFAAVDPDYKNACDGNYWDSAGSISPMAIICPIVRLLNVLVLSAGAFFVAFVFISAIKYALAQGDPKALQASKQTLTMAVIGFLVIIGVYTILTIIKNVFGLGGNAIADPFGTLSKSFAELLKKLNISVN